MALFMAKAETSTESSGTCGDDLTWSLDETSGVLTISGTGFMTDFTGWYDSDSCYHTDAPWYAYSSSIKSVIVEEGVASVGNWAFMLVYSLENVTLPSSLRFVGDNAFGNTALTSVTIPSGATAIGNYAFSNCNSLQSVSIPNSVTYIGSFAFSGCGYLTDIIYCGTDYQWEAITKIADWNSETGVYVAPWQCTYAGKSEGIGSI